MCPAVISGECLSSWLRRVGCLYGFNMAGLLKSDFGYTEVTRRWLDRKPDHDLLVAISARSGLSVEELERMTLSGTLPFLFRSACSDLENDELEDCSVLFEPSGLSSYEKLTQWFRREPLGVMICCRYCLADYPDSSLLLGWQLGVVLSCPIHKVMLEPGRNSGKRMKWFNDSAEEAPKLVCQLDRRSMEALADGFVQLPGGSVSAAQWFRLLQTIFQELNAPIIPGGGKRIKWQLKLWNEADYYPSGLFRKFKFNKSCSLLISMAIDLMEKGEVTPLGDEGYVFSEHNWESEKEVARAVYF